jgi:hypothetical protein
MADTKQVFIVKLYFDEPLNFGGATITAAQVATNIAAGMAADSTIPQAPIIEVFVPAGSGE